nr:PxKF domain-containing protein [Longispora sp. (in: high G+C Gram-positive bacteria)]
PAGVTFTAISGGHYHNLAIGSDGATYAWGLNTSGQLGDGTLTRRNVPVRVAPGAVPAGVTFTAIDGGERHSLAIGSDGAGYAWGNNSRGQLGDGTTSTNAAGSLSPVRVTPGAVPVGVTFTAISGGYSHSLAIGSDGAGYAWGRNDDGSLGDGTTTPRLNPVQVAQPAGVPITALAAGYRHSLAIVGGASDSTPPVITPQVAGTVGDNGWYTSDVTVTWNVTDPDSTVSSSTDCAPVTLTADTTGTTLTCGATSAGGTSSQSVALTRDATAPVITCPPAPTFILGQATTPITGSASDATSGLATSTTPSAATDSSSVGAKTVNLTATDNAGNTSTVTCGYNVHYAFTGFLNPVDNTEVNIVKAGQAIRVTFSLGGDQGLAVLNGSPSISWTSCTGGDTNDLTDDAVAASSSGLKYDSASGTYTYVWKTDKSWANRCGTLHVKLADGTDHTAQFQFKK